MPPWFWLVFAVAGGLASAAWAALKGASTLGTAASGALTAALGMVFLAFVIREPAAFAPGRPVTIRVAVCVLALVEALCIPAFWAARADADLQDVTGPAAAVITFLVVPALIAPPVLIGMRRRWRMSTQWPSCSGCGAYVSLQGDFCSYCGTRK